MSVMTPRRIAATVLTAAGVIAALATAGAAAARTSTPAAAKPKTCATAGYCVTVTSQLAGPGGPLLLTGPDNGPFATGDVFGWAAQSGPATWAQQAEHGGGLRWTQLWHPVSLGTVSSLQAAGKFGFTPADVTAYGSDTVYAFQYDAGTSPAQCLADKNGLAKIAQCNGKVFQAFIAAPQSGGFSWLLNCTQAGTPAGHMALTTTGSNVQMDFETPGASQGNPAGQDWQTGT